MAKKSGFDYLEGQQNKLISLIDFSGGNVNIKWKIPTESESGKKDFEEGHKKSTEPESVEFAETMQALTEWVRKFVVPDASKKSSTDWEENIYIQKVAFTHTETKGVTASIVAVKYRKVDQDKRKIGTKVILPKLPLYDEDIEGHASGTVDTYDSFASEKLGELQQHAKMYLGGCRGPERKREGEGELFDTLNHPDEPDDSEDDIA